MRIHLYILTLLILIGSSCKKDADNFPDFNTITSRDINAQPIGAADRDDWNLNDSWVSVENNLFPNTSTSTAYPLVSSLMQTAGYPNPCGATVFRISFGITTNATADVKIVDQSFNVITSAANIAADSQGRINVNLDISSIPSGQIVRAYYIVSDNSCVYRGHGDIEKQ